MEQIQILNNGDTLNAIRTKINENFQRTAQAIENINSDPFVKFCANSGNETNGVADLLTRSEDGTSLTFKVGGEYPNLVYTDGKGQTVEVSSLDPLYFENLSAGNSVVLVKGTSTQLTAANIYYQLVEPTGINSGDIWFNGSGAYQALVLEENTQWIDYGFTPIGEATFRTGKIAVSNTYPYNANGLQSASSSTMGLVRTAAPTDEMDCSCNDAVLTPANLYDVSNYRKANTEYQVDDKVGCPYHHNIQLNCIQAGTTSNEALDTKGVLEAGTTITDGSVIWEVEEIGAVDDTRFVKKSGDTMSGPLTFPNANNSPMYFNFSGLTDSTATPSTASYYGVQFNDAKGVRVGKIEASWKTDGTTTFGINAHRTVNGTAKYCQLTCSIDASGNPITSAPTPTTTDNSTKIATTAYVNNSAVMKSTLIDVSDAGIGFPSGKSVDLVLGASGSSYTAPANGWAVISKKTSAANQYVSVGIGSSIRDICFIPTSGSSAGASVQVRKGQAFYCTYSAGGTLDFFKFIYAQGEL